MATTTLSADETRGAVSKRIRIIGTGGTIARTPAGVLPIAGLVDDIRRLHPAVDLHSYAQLDFVDVLEVGSEQFTPAEWILVASEVQKAASASQVDGVVITHGTFTAEETAYFLHLTVHTEKPIVIACSQRPHSTIGNDGDRNLVDAIRVAATTEAQGKGALVVLNEEVHGARGVRKSSGRPSGFGSSSIGLLGHVDRDRVTFYASSTRRHTFNSEFSIPASLQRVDVVATYAGADGTAVSALMERGVDGLVVNGFSFNGMPHRDQVEALTVVTSAGIPVVVVNRGGDGRIAPDIHNEGFVRGDNLTAQQARVLLCLALTRTRDVAGLQRIFDEY
jgi:L-asparaginase